MKPIQFFFVAVRKQKCWPALIRLVSDDPLASDDQLENVGF
jgi:hypothetical protein